MKDVNVLRSGSYKIKRLLYEQGGFQSKPKMGKFTGFDKLKVRLNKKHKIDYNEVYRYPLICT